MTCAQHPRSSGKAAEEEGLRELNSVAVVSWASLLVLPATSPVTPALGAAFSLPPQTGQHPPWMGSGWGMPAATQSLSQTAGRVSHRGAQEKLGLWANPASENHGPSFQSLLLTAAALGMAVGWTTAVQCGPPHGAPGGPDTWGSRNLAATMHSEQPRASLSVRHQKEAAPSRGGWPTEHIAHRAYCEFQRLTLSLHKL